MPDLYEKTYFQCLRFISNNQKHSKYLINTISPPTIKLAIVKKRIWSYKAIIWMITNCTCPHLWTGFFWLKTGSGWANLKESEYLWNLPTIDAKIKSKFQSLIWMKMCKKKHSWMSSFIAYGFVSQYEKIARDIEQYLKKKWFLI